MSTKKYILTDETMKCKGRTLHRIKAVKDFNDVKKGDLGGWVQSESNLSHEGNCWIYDNAMAMDNSRVYDNACMYDNVRIWGCSEIHDDSRMYDCAEMYDDAEMHDDSRMYDNTIMCGNSCMYNNSEMYDMSEMHGYTHMHDYSAMHGRSRMWEYAVMCENSSTHGNAEIEGDAVLEGGKSLYGHLYSRVDDFIEIPNPEEGKIVTCVLKNGKILYNVGYKKEYPKKYFLKHKKLYPNIIKIIKLSELYFNMGIKQRIIKIIYKVFRR